MTTGARRRIDAHEAAALIAARMPRGWGTVKVPLDDAGGEVLRQVITAERDQPPFDRVTMDGIAIRHGAWAAGRRTFQVLGTQAAGSPPLPLTADGGCVAIMTGAALPPGADTVVPVERLVRQGETATLQDDYTPAAGQFVHRQASDHRQGDPLLAPGCILGPTEMAVLTVGGSDTVEIARRPSIAVVSTGDELVGVGQPLAPTQIRASNDRAIAAALATRGFLDTDRLHLPDDRPLLESALGELLAEQDVLILTGGVSMGEFDHVPKVLADLGMELVFHKVLQRPGRPLWFGVSPAGKPVFALPGNPVSSLVCLVRYVAPALVTALGATPRPGITVRLDRHVQFEPDLTYFLPVTMAYGADGECLATPRPTNTSGDFIALAGTDGFVELPRGMSDFAPGYTARFYPW